ncbi:MAG: hypothetical protein WC320_02010 [Candidatus Paceibacterota bacterium]|jgi:hypothetical protein
MKVRRIWFEAEGFFDLQNEEININIKCFPRVQQEDANMIKKEIEKGIKKTFHKIKLNFYDEEVPGRNDYWIHSEQQKGYNE